MDSEYTPQSGEIKGILKKVHDEMPKDLTTATNEETTAIKDYEELIAAKKKEIDALTASIETKMQRICELAISIVQMKNDLTDNKEALLGEKGFLDGLEKGCAAKTAAWEDIVKMRAEEMAALATICNENMRQCVGVVCAAVCVTTIDNQLLC